MKQALGLVEIQGLPTAIYAADAMIKAANVRLIGLENAKGLGYMTIKVEGDVGAVSAAVSVGRQTGMEFGKLVSFKVIPRPSDYVGAAFCGPDPGDDTQGKAKKRESDQTKTAEATESGETALAEDTPQVSNEAAGKTTDSLEDTDVEEDAEKSAEEAEESPAKENAEKEIEENPATEIAVEEAGVSSVDETAENSEEKAAENPTDEMTENPEMKIEAEESPVEEEVQNSEEETAESSEAPADAPEKKPKQRKRRKSTGTSENKDGK